MHDGRLPCDSRQISRSPSSDQDAITRSVVPTKPSLFALCTLLFVLAQAQRAAALGFKELVALRVRAVGPDVFVIDHDDSIKHLWQTDKSGTWGGSEDLGGIGHDIAAIELASGRFEVFVVGSDAAVWHNRQNANHKWAGWETLGGEATRLAAVKGREGRVELFVVGSDRAVWHRGRNGPTGSWSDWESLGGAVQQLAAAEDGKRGFAIFGVGTDRALWRVSSAGGDWQSLGGEADDVAVARLPNGGFQVVVVGSDATVWQIRQDAPGSGFGEWASLGMPASRVALSPAKPSGVDLFVLGLDAALTRVPAASPAAGWGASKKIDEASPFDTTFSGDARFEIPDLHVSESRNVTLGIRVSADRRLVEITSFPALETKRYDTPVGASKSTVSFAVRRAGWRSIESQFGSGRAGCKWCVSRPRWGESAAREVVSRRDLGRARAVAQAGRRSSRGVEAQSKVAGRDPSDRSYAGPPRQRSERVSGRALWRLRTSIGPTSRSQAGACADSVAAASLW
jgi:hypothetical protein